MNRRTCGRRISQRFSEAKLTPLEKHVWNILEDWRVERNLTTCVSQDADATSTG